MSNNPFRDSAAASSDVQLNVALTIPLPEGNDSFPDLSTPLQPPNPNRFSMLSPSLGMDSARESVVSDVDANSTRGITAAPAVLSGVTPVTSGPSSVDAEKNGAQVLADGSTSTDRSANGSKKRRRFLGLGVVAALVIIAAAVAIPVGVVVGRRNSNKSASGSTSDGDGSGLNPAGTDDPPNVAVITGGDGSTVTTEDGQTFVYNNKFGGFWVSDPQNPFNNNAQPNSWTPALNTSWTWGKDRVYGVNLGGWFVLEPFITPTLYQKYSSLPAVDEWTLSQAMAADTSEGGGLSQLEQHYDTFITEQDIAEIAGAGLNWIRVPVPFWAIDRWNTTSSDPEPFLEQICWKYILRLFRWARKYGLRINLDLHTTPGSQNGYNHSGKFGQVNFLNGVMGFANAQRMLDYIRVFTEFISQDEYKDLIPMFGIINEPLVQTIGVDTMSSFYLRAHDMIREITGTGAGNGPFISIHDGFTGPAQWADFLPGSDRINLDWHPYFAFDGSANTDPVGTYPAKACTWGSVINDSQSNFGVTVAGEFSNGINDCGLFVRGVSSGGSSTPAMYGGDCSLWEDSTQWNQTIKDGLRDFALASMDALQNWFFWTWKIGNSTAGTVQAPLWSYKAGLDGGWMPTDPREAVGKCAELGASGDTFVGTYSAWQTGGAGAGTIVASARASFTAWPPAQISNVDDVSLVPTYTATGTISTLPPDQFTAAPKTLSVGDGWANSGDTAGAITTVSGCSYPDPWDATDAALPVTTCGGGKARRSLITPTPSL